MKFFVLCKVFPIVHGQRRNQNNNMKIILKHINHVPSKSLIDMIKSELEALLPRLQIDEARVHLEQRLEESPPFHASFHLVTPGPDVMAEASDHTLRAALLKSFALIDDKIGHRHQKRAQKKVNHKVTQAARRLVAPDARR